MVPWFLGTCSTVTEFSNPGQALEMAFCSRPVGIHGSITGFRQNAGAKSDRQRLSDRVEARSMELNFESRRETCSEEKKAARSRAIPLCSPHYC